MIASVIFPMPITPSPWLVTFARRTLTWYRRSHPVWSDIRFCLTVQCTRSDQLWERRCKPLADLNVTGTRSVPLSRIFVIALPHMYVDYSKNIVFKACLNTALALKRSIVFNSWRLMTIFSAFFFKSHHLDWEIDIFVNCGTERFQFIDPDV